MGLDDTDSSDDDSVSESGEDEGGSVKFVGTKAPAKSTPESVVGEIICFAPLMYNPERGDELCLSLCQRDISWI